MQFDFDRIQHVENAKTYLDMAFGKAKTESDNARGSFAGSKILDRIQKSHIAELSKIETIKSVLVTAFDRIGKSFPSVNTLPQFYQELIDLTMDRVQLIKSLAAINWAKRQIIVLHQDHSVRIRRSKNLEQMNSLRRMFYGRVSSVIKQISKDLDYLSSCKKKFKDFPTVRDNIFTVCISGFPNVGKSTLLSRLTTSTPEINSYPFTTKQILVGNIKEKQHIIQVLDTPGTLARLEKMNNIEKQAHLAMKYCADLIIYVFDLTMEYPLEDQEKLYKIVRKYGKETMVYFSKTDIIPKEEIDIYAQSIPASTVRIMGGPPELRKLLLQKIK